MTLIIPNGVLNCLSMFVCCLSLKKAYDIPNSVIECSRMFQGCTSLEYPVHLPCEIKKENAQEVYLGCTLIEKHREEYNKEFLEYAKTNNMLGLPKV